MRGACAAYKSQPSRKLARMENEITLLPLMAAAQRFGVPAKWLKNEAEAERIPHLRAGNRILFDLQTLAACLKQRATKNGAEAGHA